MRPLQADGTQLPLLSLSQPRPRPIQAAPTAWPPCCFWDTPRRLPPQGFCTCCSFCLKHASLRHGQGFFSLFRSMSAPQRGPATLRKLLFPISFFLFPCFSLIALITTEHCILHFMHVSCVCFLPALPSGPHQDRTSHLFCALMAPAPGTQ